MFGLYALAILVTIAFSIFGWLLTGQHQTRGLMERITKLFRFRRAWHENRG